MVVRQVDAGVLRQFQRAVRVALIGEYLRLVLCWALLAVALVAGAITLTRVFPGVWAGLTTFLWGHAVVRLGLWAQG